MFDPWSNFVTTAQPWMSKLLDQIWPSSDRPPKGRHRTGPACRLNYGVLEQEEMLLRSLERCEYKGTSPSQVESAKGKRRSLVLFSLRHLLATRRCGEELGMHPYKKGSPLADRATADARMRA